ncbi:MAG: MarR family transcriptional regulator [Clostridia bacterium]|nr:MarR family transcriptional regulator [Clostridia bacterium]
MADRYDALKLENQLCFPLYACAREVVKAYTPYLDELGITYTQYVTMMVLWEHKQITSKLLGQKLHLDSGTLTPVLKKLEEKGYLTRHRLPEDERNLCVEITDEGMALREKALTVPQRMAASCAQLSPEEAGALYGLLYKLLDKYQG